MNFLDYQDCDSIKKIKDFSFEYSFKLWKLLIRILIEKFKSAVSERQEFAYHEKSLHVALIAIFGLSNF